MAPPYTLARPPRLPSFVRCSFAREAARGGHLQVLQWAKSQGCSWNKQTSSFAAAGHLEVLQWAKSQGCSWDEETCTWAAREGHLEVLMLAELECEGNEHKCFCVGRTEFIE